MTVPGTENTFPTIKDARDVLTDLIEQGYGDLPVQIIVAPDSTLQALARAGGARHDETPALMIKFTPEQPSKRRPVCIISTARLHGSDKRTAVQ